MPELPAACVRSGVTRRTLFMVLYLYRMCQYGLHEVLWAHIGILMRLFAAEPQSTARPFSLSVSLWIDLADPVMDGVGLSGFKSKANTFLFA